MKFSGRFDEYKVECSDCSAPITATDADGLFDGKRVECTDCGANTVASNDGGIWKLHSKNTPLKIKIVN